MHIKSLSFDDLPDAVSSLINEVRELKDIIKGWEDKEDQEDLNTPDLITISEACKLLNISRGTLYRYQKQGKVKVYGIGARRLLKRSEVMEALTPKN